MELMTNKMTMSSYDFLQNVINPARLEIGESVVRNNVFVARIEDEIDDLDGYKTFVTGGNEVKYYELTFDQMMLVGMRESKAVRKNVLAKLKELEQPKQIAIPQTLSEALQLAADQAKQLELQAPKVNYFNKVVERENLLNATQVAQKIRLSAVKMNRYLDEMKVYNNSIKRGRAFQQWFVDKGYGVMRQTELGYAQPMFTLIGEAWIVEALTAEGVA